MKDIKYHIFIALVSLIIGIFFIIAGIEAYSEYVIVKRYEGITTGYILKKYFQRSSDGNSIYYLDYWFTLSDGKRIVSTNSILKENWEVLKIDDKLEIRYDQSNPDRNIPMYGGSLSLAYVFLIIILGTVFIVFGVARLIISFNMPPRKKSILTIHAGK